MKKLLFLFVFIPFITFSQSDSVKAVVKIAGVTVTSDSLKPVPFVNVLIKGNYTGTMGDYSGFYSIIAKAGDTLIFSSMGYRKEEYIIQILFMENPLHLFPFLTVGFTGIL